MSAPEPPPSVRPSVPTASSQSSADGPYRGYEPVAWSRRPKSAAMVRWESFARRAALIVLALCVVFFGVEFWGAGLHRIRHGQNDTHPLGYCLIGLGMVMVFVVPIVLMILAFRRHGANRERDAAWADDG